MKKNEEKIDTKEIKVEEKVIKDESLIISPRLTEKSSNVSVKNIYTFNVKKDATKISLAAEIKKLYKVSPIKINISNNPRQATFSRGKFGLKSGFKKAMVFLKKGDTINLA